LDSGDGLARGGTKQFHHGLVGDAEEQFDVSALPRTVEGNLTTGIESENDQSVIVEEAADRAGYGRCAGTMSRGPEHPKPDRTQPIGM
jgi:hypothetical protein